MKLRTAYCSAVRAWDKKIRLVGRTPVEALYDESLEAFKSAPATFLDQKTLVDIGAGNGIVGFPWLALNSEHKAVFVEPDIKKAAFILNFVSSSEKELGLSSRCLVIPQRLEDVPRETIEKFADGGFCLVTRAFSGNKTLADAFGQSQLKKEDLFVFDLVNGHACFKKLR